MKRQIPEGTLIGEIEAPLALLLSHIPNFLGAIIIRISTGKGFILFEYGRPVGYSFVMGDLVLEGAAARRFFQQEEVLKASLRRYSEKEFQEALAVAWPNALIPLSPGRQVINTVDSSPAPANPLPATEYRAGDTVPGGIDHLLVQDEPVTRTQGPGGLESDDPTGAVLDRFIRSPGVIAAAFFREGSITASRGRAITGDLVEPAEEILLPAWEAMALVSDGPLVQITLQLADRNVTIAPYDDGYLLFMTEPGINLGRIRRLLQEGAGIGVV
jgi:hypothetical protein